MMRRFREWLTELHANWDNHYWWADQIYVAYLGALALMLAARLMTRGAEAKAAVWA